ncbi:ESX secretion-associated protein EspG [Mycobacterium shigaense]|uniref:ESX-2 secretion-associated protein EspG2 n=1 Tax=Mycobacterium shigaense TaxID=722731 RepID=A0A1Z4EQ55_9MYCO|nr:ESX secretion-associated protein EspG [Mycobacterium shigaense]MEA1121516.1 ESX secretion-associated protein EspG [Mycobacterium shigaense]PRI15196.1 ESX secretion-associated protein EspG [Mycobacterium shigaense]BAX95070.1 ESX-2 secretion-associated protein EspG2 [Mycobacterium shigaense]
MLTTTLDGLWVLQVLTGIEVLSPEMGLRPHLPSVEPKRLALEHPVAAELRAAGVIDELGVVDSTVVEWLTVLSRRDVGLVVHFRAPGDGDEPARALLARFAQWWVVMERSADIVRMSGAGVASNEGSASAAVSAQIERLCGGNEPAALRPVTVDAEAMRAAAADQESLRAFFEKQGLDHDQLHTLELAADPERSAQASFVAIQSGVDTGRPSRTYVEPGAVTVIDTPEGRLVAEHVRSAGTKWMIIAPGNKNNIATAINQMMRRLPADQEWYSYRKVV